MPRQVVARKPARMSGSSGSGTKRPGQLLRNETKDLPPILFSQRRGITRDPGAGQERTGCAAASEEVFREYPNGEIRGRKPDHQDVLSRGGGSSSSATDVSGKRRGILAG